MSIDEEVTFKLFSNEGGTTGIKFEDAGMSCSLAAMVCYKVTIEQVTALCSKAIFDSEGLHGGIIGVKLKDVKEIMDIGEWSFGFLGDVTPRDLEKVLVFIVADSPHVIWISTMVE